MYKIRLVVFSVFAILAVSAVASVSASAIMPAYDVNGTLVVGHLHVLITKAEQSGKAVLKGTLAGVKVTIECEEENGLGTVNNLNAMGESTATLHYLKCAVAAPAGQGCLVLNELVQVAPTNDLLLLLTPSAGYRDDFTPAAGTAFAAILIDHCTTEALNGTFNVTGAAAAEVNNATSNLEFTEKSGSALKFGGNAATYVDTIHVLTLGGQRVLVENGNLAT